MQQITSSYKKEIALKKIELSASGKMLLDANEKLKKALATSTSHLTKIGENSQLDEAVLLAILSGFGKDFAAIAANIRVTLEEYKKNGLDESVNILQARLDRCTQLKDQIEAYNRYHVLLAKRQQLEKQLEEMRNNQSFDPEEKEKAEKSLLDILGKIKDIYDKFDFISEDSMLLKFKSIEDKLLGEDNPIAFVRENLDSVLGQITDISDLPPSDLSEKIISLIAEGIDKKLLDGSAVKSLIEPNENLGEYAKALLS